jgi:multiple sugar transport system substrate-binding protein
MRLLAATSAVAIALLAAACGSSDKDKGAKSTDSPAPTGVNLQLMFGSSGDAETNAIKAAAKEWGDKTGNTVEVIPAKDINQELTQALAGGTPPDVFYIDASRFRGLAEGNSLWLYGDKLADKGDFYPGLVDTFTYNGQLACAPKDFSTLALQINTSMWQEAGLTDADIPTNWDQLAAVAKKLTTKDHAGLVVGDTRDRLGAFARQAGGWWLSADGTAATADSAENLEAMNYVKSLLSAGSLKFPKQVDAGWAGEAFGKQKAAMVMEGNWIQGAMKNDFPDVKYKVVELPAGPKGKGTLTFTQCWGIAAASKNQDAALDFVTFLTTPDQQLKFAEAFGVMPSRQAARAGFEQLYPEAKAFVAGGEYAQGPVTIAGFDQVLSDFDAALAEFADGTIDGKALLARLQQNSSDALKG